jgi:8-oxo-dGTP pyrophosphatase MutT (NUDIX family)
VEFNPTAAEIAARLRARAPRRLDRGAEVDEATVALLLRPAAGWELLFIHRAERGDDPWSAQMAFPGGRREPADASLLEALGREVSEEVGVDLERSTTLLGALDETEPVTRRERRLVIAPFVFALTGQEIGLRCDPREVQASVWIPLDALLDPAAATEIAWRGRAYPAIGHGRHVIWGITYRLLKEFLGIVTGGGG